MQKYASTKCALLLVIFAAACSSTDERALVVLDIQLGSGVAAPDSVHLSATQAGAEVKAADVPWTKATNGVLEIGLFIPSGVTGPLTVAATGRMGTSPVLEGSVDQPIPLKAGGSVGPFTIVLRAAAVPPVTYDGGVDGGPLDTGIPDSTVFDGPVPDAIVVPLPTDTRSADAGTVDGLTPAEHPVADTGTLDVPVFLDGALDAADANLGQPDGPQVQSDTVPTIEAGHTPAWEPGQNIENDIINTSHYPAITVDPINEHVYVAWYETSAVKVKRWNRTSGAWEKTILVENRGGPQNVAIGADAKGNVLLVWCQNTSGGDTALEGVWSSKTTDGLAWSSPVRVASLHSWNLQLAVARNGTARAVYTKLASSSSWPLYTAYFDGTSWTENPTMVADNTNYMEQDARLVVSGTGDGILIFDKEDDNYDTGVAAVTLTGQSFSAPTYLNPNYPAGRAESRAIAMNRKGEAVFVWSEYAGSSPGLLARTYNPSLGWSSVPPPIVSSDSIDSVAAALDAQDNVTILFQMPISSGGMNVMGIHGSLTGAWSDITVLETDNVAGNLTSDYAFPQLAIDATGNVLAVWRKDLSTKTTSTFGVYASRYSGTWLSQAKLGLKTGLDVLSINVAVADSGFGAATFYYYSENTTSDPEAYNTFVAFFR